MRKPIKSEALEKFNVKEHKDNFGHSTIRPQGRTAHTAPEILEEYQEEEVDQESGESTFTRMYKCKPAEGGLEPVHYLADKYDAMFIPAHDKKRRTATAANYKRRKK
jgi:hypothetical protein